MDDCIYLPFHSFSSSCRNRQKSMYEYILSYYRMLLLERNSRFDIQLVQLLPNSQRYLHFTIHVMLCTVDARLTFFVHLNVSSYRYGTMESPLRKNRTILCECSSINCKIFTSTTLHRVYLLRQSLFFHSAHTLLLCYNFQNIIYNIQNRLL